ncbi:MAG: 3-dehydroquinate synthase [Negativicutes bacterium]|jgi:3-dehydroquinate synthase
MEKVTVNLGKNSYNIHIGQKTLETVGINFAGADKVFVLTDNNVNRLQHQYIEKALAAVEYRIHEISAGETAKSFHSVAEIITAMTQFCMTRKSLVIAFGGGVIGDLAGFCASIYMRGVRYIQVPTTLLAQTDSSIGGKTGINTEYGKNLVGSFYQPQAVYIDIDLLHSLPRREYRAGVGEIIKYGLIEAWLLGYIDKNYKKIMNCDYEVMTFLIRECCRIKASVVSQDEAETNLRKVLNVGHTFGHALEVATNYQYYLHGEAVLLGMYYETLLAKKLKVIDAEYADEIFAVIGKTGIDVSLTQVNLRTLPKLMSGDKKNTTGKISFILPVGHDRYQEQQLSLRIVEEFCSNI